MSVVISRTRLEGDVGVDAGDDVGVEGLCLLLENRTESIDVGVYRVSIEQLLHDFRRVDLRGRPAQQSVLLSRARDIGVRVAQECERRNRDDTGIVACISDIQVLALDAELGVEFLPHEHGAFAARQLE